MNMLLISLHDVAPYHLRRLHYAERLFAEWGVQKITYLLIPDYLGRQRADQSRDFADFMAARRPFELQWFLHGYYHLAWNDSTGKADCELPPDATNKQLGQANNDEFQNIAADICRNRLERGARVFQDCLGAAPAGFVAPRWRLDRRAMPVLADLGFKWTERITRIVHLPSGRSVASPVITWATRTWSRRWTSLLGTPLLSFASRREPVLRIAMHPFDFDYPATIRSIERVLQCEIGRRQQAFYDELDGLVSAAPRSNVRQSVA